jgi:hypothetical protein
MRSKSIAIRIIFASLLFSIWLVAFAYAQAPRFNSEYAAQTHCPRDIVVWLNLPTGVYHFKGQRWYGATKNGAYVCRTEADAEGDRATRNGLALVLPHLLPHKAAITPCAAGEHTIKAESRSMWWFAGKPRI